MVLIPTHNNSMDTKETHNIPNQPQVIHHNNLVTLVANLVYQVVNQPHMHKVRNNLMNYRVKCLALITGLQILSLVCISTTMLFEGLQVSH